MTSLKKKKQKLSKSSPKKGKGASAPKHVAIIMDGNGRWATAKGLPRTEGHKKGCETVRRTVEAAAESGVRYLTLFAFSAENWKRPKPEVNLLMGLVEKYLVEEQTRLMKENVRLRIIGEREGLPQGVIRKIAEVEEKTRNNTRLDLVIALNYGGRQEIVNAARKAMEEAKKGFISPEDLTENMFGKYLYTQDIPPVDLMIRTSGEQRLSNFLLWQVAYAELLFVKKHWPAFTKADFKAALEVFNKRTRRFGGLTEKTLGKGK